MQHGPQLHIVNLSVPHQRMSSIGPAAGSARGHGEAGGGGKGGGDAECKLVLMDNGFVYLGRCVCGDSVWVLSAR